MNAAEAITRLIQFADSGEYDLLTDEAREELKLATAVVTAILNTMMPITRYRAFVEIEEVAKKRHAVGNVTAEFTVCAVSMAGIKSGLSGVSVNDMEIRAMVFEQTKDGATLVSGFQGFTKSQKYRSWFNTLESLEEAPTVQ